MPGERHGEAGDGHGGQGGRGPDRPPQHRQKEREADHVHECVQHQHAKHTANRIGRADEEGTSGGDERSGGGAAVGDHLEVEGNGKRVVVGREELIAKVEVAVLVDAHAREVVLRLIPVEVTCLIALHGERQIQGGDDEEHHADEHPLTAARC